jgi:uncharacterized protein with ATP-grasp and redox domains
MDKQHETYNKTLEILSKFSNDSKTKYQQDALFHQVVQMLARTDDPYMVIEQLIQITNDCQNALKHHLINCNQFPLIKQ